MLELARERELTSLLRDSIERALAPRVAIAFSGGLDSSTIATVAKARCEVRLLTLDVRGEAGEDLPAAREVAEALGLRLDAARLSADQVVADFEACQALMPGSATELELMVGTRALAREAQRLGETVMLTGSGAEEAFVGYHKYYAARERGMDLRAILEMEYRTLPDRDLARTRAVCATQGIEPRFPFMDARLHQALGTVALEELLDDGVAKKPLLRRLAAHLGVPESAVRRPKKAMQYGSRLHTLMNRLVREGRLPRLEARVPDWLQSERMGARVPQKTDGADPDA